MDLIDPLEFDRKRLTQVLERRYLEEQRCKSTFSYQSNSKQALNKDLAYILHGQKVRKVGEMPNFIGNYERIAPTELSDKLVKFASNNK